MVNLSPDLSLFLLIFLPVAGLVIGRIGRSLKKVSTRVQEKLGDILTTIEETLGGIRVVKGFNAEDHQLKRFVSENEKLLEIKQQSDPSPRLRLHRYQKHLAFLLYVPCFIMAEGLVRT
jgi:ABC-type multidrug transport system fused ATPase/permease subunit